MAARRNVHLAVAFARELPTNNELFQSELKREAEEPALTK